jgi:hypothetical protein
MFQTTNVEYVESYSLNQMEIDGHIFTDPKTGGIRQHLGIPRKLDAVL